MTRRTTRSVPDAGEPGPRDPRPGGWWRRWGRRPRRPPVYNLHHLGNDNIGDRACVPLTYFAHLAHPALTIIDLSLTDPIVATLRRQYVILGGGGLLNPWCWHEVILPLLRRRNRVIAWGIGHHHDNVPEHRYAHARVEHWRESLPRYAHDYPLGRLWIASVRDAGTPFEWVPCPSCMHPAFDDPPAPTHELVVYEQGVLEPITVEGVPKMRNMGAATVDEAIRFLASGRTVLTNSYHGAYWGTLLGRRVLVWEPWCSKFELLRHPLPSCTAADWSDRLAVAAAYPEALDQCRRRNQEFAEMVFAALERRLLPRALRRHPPLG